MKASVKAIIKSIAVLSIIAIVCVGVLSLANEFLKKDVVLDLATTEKINELCPSGVDYQTAYDEDYFVMLTETELSESANGFSLKNYKNNASNKVVAVYYARKGNSAGTYVIESVAKGYRDLSVLTAFTVEDGDYFISGVLAKSTTEDDNFKQIFNDEYFSIFVEMVKGGKTIYTDNEILAQTGATTKNSVRGLNTAVTLSIKAMDGLYQYDEQIKALAQGGND